MVISLNMTQLALRALRAGALAPLLRSKGRSASAVVCALYAGLMVACFEAWRQQRLGVEQFGPLKERLANQALRQPASVVRSFERASQRAPRTVESEPVSPSGVAFNGGDARV